MRSKLIITALTTLLIFSGLNNAYAGGCNKGKCNKSGWKKSQGLKEKFFCTVKKIYKNKDLIGLTEEQIKELKALKVKTKKELIRKHADIEIIKVDIKAALCGDLDVDTVNKLIDQKYEHKKAKAKLIVAAIADLKKIITEEQCAKLKSNCAGKSCEKSSAACDKTKK